MRARCFIRLGAGGLLLAWGAHAADLPAAEPATRGVKLPVSTPDAAWSEGKVLALVVGINDYRDAPPGQGWNDLRAARADAEAVAGVLRDKYGYQTTTLLDGEATRERFMAALDEAAGLAPEDSLLIYYAGHGYYDEAMGEGFWIPSDARLKSENRLAREDWIWNSTITKMLGASKARHVLVIADACYGGSLFRGAETGRAAPDDQWYRRAAGKPSRYLITSGDLEQVLDGEGAHSVFAQQVLHGLNYPDRAVFAASDLGLSVRERVSELTGQMVRMGPLRVASDAGGEFVFVVPSAGQDFQPERSAEPLDVATSEPLGTAAALQEAIRMKQQGATRSAAQFMAQAALPATSAVVRAVQQYVAGTSAFAPTALQSLLDRLEGRLQAAPGPAPLADTPRPRVLACLGPTMAGGVADDSLAAVYRFGLAAALDELGGVRVVEREQLEQVLQEQELGTSGLADERARTAIGRLLPASTLLMGQVVQLSGQTRVMLRLVDTETSQVLGSFSAGAGVDGDPDPVCRELGEKIMAVLRSRKPLRAEVAATDGGQATVPLGAFHGLRPGQVFDVFADGSSAPAVGRATVLEVQEDQSILQMQKLADGSHLSLRVVESAVNKVE